MMLLKAGDELAGNEKIQKDSRFKKMSFPPLHHSNNGSRKKVAKLFQKRHRDLDKKATGRESQKKKRIEGANSFFSDAKPSLPHPIAESVRKTIKMNDRPVETANFYLKKYHYSIKYEDLPFQSVIALNKDQLLLVHLRGKMRIGYIYLNSNGKDSGFVEVDCHVHPKSVVGGSMVLDASKLYEGARVTGSIVELGSIVENSVVNVRSVIRNTEVLDGSRITASNLSNGPGKERKQVARSTFFESRAVGTAFEDCVVSKSDIRGQPDQKGLLLSKKIIH